MKKTICSLWLLSLSIMAQPKETFPLWPGEPPGALGQADKDIPTLTPFWPETPNGTGASIVVCPGGGYGGLAQHEGKDYALWLNQNGIAAFVLKYRLGSGGYRHPVMLQDVARAIRLVRARASEWNLNPNRIGVMGSSAGGHLASTILTHFDQGKSDHPDPIERQSSRPDLGILCYPVITMKPPFTHQGSRNNLLGQEPSEALVELLSNETQVTAQTPPTFLWHTVEDKAVPVENSLQFAAALRKAGVPFDLHLYQQGRHGLGLADKPPFANAHPWARDCLFWLKTHNFQP
ncbi:MAG: alpha/beta hydrolase [Verrucomicrobiota bacterium]|jgi:acetyl esterase/lipase